MFLSVFDMFKVGIGPSSSHTMGPMVAAARFLDQMRASPFHFAGLRASLHGSLAFTGVGHATDRATILGLAGFTPETYDADQAEKTLKAIEETGQIVVEGLPALQFNPKSDLVFDYDLKLPGHANGMMLMATDAQGDVTLRETYYSIGGGFVMTEAELAAGKDTDEGAPVPFPFKTAAEMLEMAASSGKTIAQMKRANEVSRNGEIHLRDGTRRLWQVMNDCIDRGLSAEGILPGGLKVRRRAKGIHDALLAERGLLPARNALAAAQSMSGHRRHSPTGFHPIRCIGGSPNSDPREAGERRWPMSDALPRPAVAVGPTSRTDTSHAVSRRRRGREPI